MTKYAGGNLVKSGYYWNTSGWSVVAIPPEGGVLPGAAGARHLRLPLPVLFVVVPVMGALFVVFLPFIGFALTLHAIVRKLGGEVRKSTRDLAVTVTPGWVPGEAHLTGKPGAAKEGETAAPPGKEEPLEKLGKEIEEKRGERG